jgi:2-methylcitrate dehydratase PrpD
MSDGTTEARAQRATKADYNVAALDLNVTRDLGAFLARFRFEDLPERAVHEARRGLIDWVGCALAGSRHPTIDKLLKVLTALGSPSQATVLGRRLKLGLLEAPLANGQMGHMLDYDDTHMGGVVLHTSGPILSALLALLERGGYGGRDLICAYAAGFEAGVRTGQSAPGHHAGGWHLTGTLGSIAAGAAAARLIGLDAQRMTYALGIAATQAAGMQQNRGTMCKSFHAGKAGANGVLAALLAEQGFDSSEEIIEGKRGFCRIYSDTAAPERVLEGLGQRWEIARNGHKPYACGVVLHPALDAMVALGKRSRLLPDQIARVALQVHPLAVRLTGLADPSTGLQSKFSIYHASAAAYLDGAAGIAQFTDARAGAPDIIALRHKIEVTTDESLRNDEARATIIPAGGEPVTVHIAHASGTVDNPMSDDAIEAKFLANAAPVIGEERARQFVALAWRLDTVADARELVRLCA